MRPRPDAAENCRMGRRRRRRRPASMRPRPDAAENRGRSPPSGPCGCRFNEAAARCRGKRDAAARQSLSRRPRFNEAAARCRGKQHHRRGRPRPAGGFNEAAARCRGKRRGCGSALRSRGASMRPRPDAAENAAVTRTSTAGIRRFNEAAARCRGKHQAPDVLAARRRASMRPRPDAAENAEVAVHDARDLAAASMRPRPDAAENWSTGSG